MTATWFALRKLRPKPEHWQMSSGRRPSVCSPAVPRWLSRALRGAALGAIAGAALVVLIVFLVPTLPIHVPRGSRGAVLLIACLAPTIVAAIIGALIQQSPPHGVVVLNADSFVEPERLVLRPSTAKWLLILRCAESPSHRASDRQKGLLGLISQDKLRPALRATLRHADLETSSAQAARWYSLISPWRRC